MKPFSQKKCILIVLDGIGDRSYARLNHRTPLQAARTPVLDELAKTGANGLYHPALLGQALPSENAHFIMFGYDLSDFPGRGALEALGAGIPLDKKDVAVLAHFARLRESEGMLFLEKGKPQIPEEKIPELANTISKFNTDSVQIRFIHTRGIRGNLILKGNVAPFITDSDPFVDGQPLNEIMPWLNHEGDKGSRNAADAVKGYLLWAYDRLKNQADRRSFESNEPANGIVTQRAGQLKHVDAFKQRYGLAGLSISSGIVYWGLSTYVGMDCAKVEDTDDPGADMAARLRLASEALDRYDFIHIHTKTPDQAAHTKDPIAKQSVIESLDRGIGPAIKPLLNNPNVIIIVTADHSTPSFGPLIHSGESVPITFIGHGVRRDRVSSFDEISAATGALGCVRGKELMHLVLNHLDRVKLQGIMDTPIDQPHWPGNYQPFRMK